MLSLLLLILGLGAIAIGGYRSQDVHRLAWICTGGVVLGWTYWWSPPSLQLAFTLLTLGLYPLLRVNPRFGKN